MEIPALAEPLFDGDRSNRISQPILYAIGNESGPVFESAQQHFLSLIPSTKGVVLPGVNHLMQMRDPKPVAELIASFLSRHPIDSA